ncbi:MAG: anti-sigma factor, partial [Pyrinomonadaceae bacterium]
MRTANCKYVCREIEEADHGQRLSTSVTEHLAGCPQCQSFHAERTKLRQLVASLETVAAPPDFNLRVRSRLANEKADGHAGYFFSHLSFGFPSVALATLVLIVGGVFALRAWNASTNSST